MASQKQDRESTVATKIISPSGLQALSSMLRPLAYSNPSPQNPPAERKPLSSSSKAPAKGPAPMIPQFGSVESETDAAGTPDDLAVHEVFVAKRMPEPPGHDVTDFRVHTWRMNVSSTVGGPGKAPNVRHLSFQISGGGCRDFDSFEHYKSRASGKKPESTDDATTSRAQDQGDGTAALQPNALPESDKTLPARSIPAITASHSDSQPNHDATGDATTSSADAGPGSLPEPSQVSFTSAFPVLSPPLPPVEDRPIEEIRMLSDDEEDELPTLKIENLLAETRPSYASQKRSQEKIPPRSSKSPVKSEKGVSKPQSGIKREGTPTLSPAHSIIDLCDDSPPLQSRSHSVEESISTPTKRKHAPLSPDTASPPAKRSKKLSAAAPAHKHEDHWALDGNIIIQIQDVKYKLQKSHLAKHSPWFCGLFDGQKVAGGEYVERTEDDSTPMYILSLPDLTAKDFTRLLDAFDKAITYVHKDPSSQRIASILRVSTLLSFPDFRDWAVRILEDTWSPVLADLSRKTIPHATEAVLLARSFDVPTILKRALYELVRLVGYGQTDRDGVSNQDYRALVKAREQLTAAWWQTMMPYSPNLMLCASASPPADPAAPAPAADPAAPAPAADPVVPTRPRCTTTDPFKSAQAYQKLVQEPGIADDYLYDPLCGLQVLIDADWAGEGYCDGCVKRRREMWVNKREKLWENLDIWLDCEH
ncbi:hypothetical protein MSAN_02274700 [Mycena sanguinolenta]|uniref:BTB domain-containing protein n=1 Tax=Mycena sanguinolenta TaxID=230812 RepID=A0A8H6XA07_9AGAR|nr:hypothetical protein MSAN_02274700 [Mycena sanguinolenta]